MASHGGVRTKIAIFGIWLRAGGLIAGMWRIFGLWRATPTVSRKTEDEVTRAVEMRVRLSPGLCTARTFY